MYRLINLQWVVDGFCCVFVLTQALQARWAAKGGKALKEPFQVTLIGLNFFQSTPMLKKHLFESLGCCDEI